MGFIDAETIKTYQISDEYPPDKASQWNHPPERDGWMLSHNALRAEMSTLKDVMEAIKDREDTTSGGGGLKQWELDSLRKVVDGHLEHITAHHRGEDEIFNPEYKKRFKFPEKLETDHITLDENLERIRSCIDKLQIGDRIDELLHLWTGYQDMMLPHLQEEEDVGLPLMRAYFVQKDFEHCVEKVMKLSPKFELGSIIYSMTPEAFRNEFMTREGIPAILWYLVFQFKYYGYLNEFVDPCKALKEGTEPKTVFSWFKQLFGFV